MNFLNLFYFTVVAEELNISRAAERLYISQQALSNHILKLEKSLDIKLFERTPNFSLTYAGTRLLRSANQILDIRRQITNEIDDINNHKRGELRLGISHTRGRVVLPKILPEYCNLHPLIDISVVEGNSEQLEDWLCHGKIDFLIGFAPIILDDVETVEIERERLLLVVPRKIMKSLFPDSYERIAEEYKRGVDVSSFKNCPYLMVSTGNRTRTIFDNYMRNKSITMNIILEMENNETLLSLAYRGMGITVYPELFVKNLSSFATSSDAPVYFFPLNDPSTIGSLVVAYRKDRYLADSAKDFIRDLQNAVR
jgi:Transcriptional regulator